MFKFHSIYFIESNRKTEYIVFSHSTNGKQTHFLISNDFRCFQVSSIHGNQWLCISQKSTETPGNPQKERKKARNHSNPRVTPAGIENDWKARSSKNRQEFREFNCNHSINFNHIIVGDFSWLLAAFDCYPLFLTTSTLVFISLTHFNDFEPSWMISNVEISFFSLHWNGSKIWIFTVSSLWFSRLNQEKPRIQSWHSSFYSFIRTRRRWEVDIHNVHALTVRVRLISGAFSLIFSWLLLISNWWFLLWKR